MQRLVRQVYQLASGRTRCYSFSLAAVGWDPSLSVKQASPTRQVRFLTAALWKVGRDGAQAALKAVPCSRMRVRLLYFPLSESQPARRRGRLESGTVIRGWGSCPRLSASAQWQTGYAADCNPVYPSSTLGCAFRKLNLEGRGHAWKALRCSRTEIRVLWLPLSESEPIRFWARLLSDAVFAHWISSIPLSAKNNGHPRVAVCRSSCSSRADIRLLGCRPASP